jgi:hypothetical protein
VTERPITRRGTILSRSAHRDSSSGGEADGERGQQVETSRATSAPARQRPLVAEPLPVHEDQIEAEAYGPAAGQPGPSERRVGKATRMPTLAWIAITVLLIAALLLAAFGLQQRSKVQSTQRQAQQLRQVSGALVAALTTYDYQNMDDWKARVQVHAVGHLRDSFNQLAPGTTQLVTGTHQRSTGTVQEVLVGQVQGGKATTMVLVNVTVTGLSGTRQFASHDHLTLLKVGGQWQVDDLDSVNYDPSTGTGATPSPGTSTPAGPTTAPTTAPATPPASPTTAPATTAPPASHP